MTIHAFPPAERPAGKSERLLWLEARFCTTGRRYDSIRRDPQTTSPELDRVRFRLARISRLLAREHLVHRRPS